MRNLDVQTPGPSASLVDPDETLKKKEIEKNPEAPKSTAERDTQVQYSGLVVQAKNRGSYKELRVRT
jgi:hypothetical protein